MSEQTAPGVFISYSSQDRFIATMVAQHLREIGYHPWVDFSGISGGDEWQARIEQALEDSQACVVLLTPEAVASQWVRWETNRARELGRPVIPLLFRTCELPKDLSALHYLDFRDDVEDSFKGLARALTNALWRAPDSGDVVGATSPDAPAIPLTPPPVSSHPAFGGRVGPPGPGYGAGVPSSFTVSAPAIEKGQPIERVVISGQADADARASARRYLAGAGFRLRNTAPAMIFTRGADWLAFVIQIPRNVRREITIDAAPAYGGQPTFHVVYEVFPPIGWTINAQERAFWRAEITELENAIATGQISYAESRRAERALMPRALQMSCVTIVLLLVLLLMLYAVLGAIASF
jgi:hypothetical protein